MTAQEASGSWFDPGDDPVDPHAAAPDEDPMEHLGPEIADPWEDDSQGDWVTQTVVTAQAFGVDG